ncbi:MAG: proprotein convertase P-domain-containing protein [Phycisphaerales bacterium]
MKLSLRISTAAGLALAAAPALAQLYDNGPLITGPATCSVGNNSSALQTGNNLLGSNVNNDSFRIADDFTVPAAAPGWQISSVRLFTYQTGASHLNPSTIAGATLRIWDGPPNVAGSTVLFGDTTTNRMTSTSFSTIFRHGAGCLTNRPIMQVDATVGVSLPPGTYWLDWGITPTGAIVSGPWQPLVTILGQRNKAGSNGLQLVGATWQAIEDAGSQPPAPQDAAFTFTGTVAAPAPGACCFIDGTCQQLTIAACATGSGVFRGDGVTCAAAACPQPGACCNADGTCQVVAASLCTGADQVYHGNSSTCAGANCAATGACCGLDGVCAVVTAASCQGSNGLYRGAASTCAAANCPTPYPYVGAPVFIVDATGQNGTFCGPESIAEITVADSFTVGAVDVSMFITHEWQGDLVFTLTHVPSNTSVEFYNRVPFQSGGSYDANNFGASPNNADLFRVIDSAANFYRTPPVPAGGIPGARGHWKPDVSLAAFAGVNSAGVWRLRVKDCGGPADIGNLEYWLLSLHRPGAAVCYANCDNSTQAPVLNVADFGCFLTRYASGDPYANCDASTQPPVLNVADFGCFLTKYAAGCP